ncbi:MAG: hypothetical protein NC911_08695, partial [Candidatus Omnitrophica bacterium]|nr:hypothetical protein [Candidatus Omnitrophota bacterium]
VLTNPIWIKILLPGDINGDSQVNIQDAILCLRLVLGENIQIDKRVYTAPYPEWLGQRGDVNADRNLDITDVVTLLRKIISQINNREENL